MSSRDDSPGRKPIKLSFHESNGSVDQTIDALIASVGGVGHPRFVREMILAALKAGQDVQSVADLKLMNTTMKEMRYTTKVFAPYRHVRKVTVFGSARTQPHEPAYKAAVELGRRLKESGFMVITGGGPGIMQAVNEGAGSDASFGINIRLPFEQRTNPVLDGNPRSVVYKYFFNRKVAFLKEAHAVALFPGGFGTLDEAMETLTLVQTGKRDIIPLLLIDPTGSHYWSKWLSFFKTELSEMGYISPSDFKLFRRVESAEEAVRHIDRFYRRYHSMRYVGDRLVLRLQRPLSETGLATLRASFTDVLTPGGVIAPSGPLPEEENEPDLAHLPRLIIGFNRMHFGRLRELIDAINAS